MSQKPKTLEESLLAYRINHQPIEFSIKQHYVNEHFSSDDYLDLTLEEQESFRSRLDECKVTVFKSITDRDGGIQKTLFDVLSTIIDPFNKHLLKKNRNVVYTSYDGTRPTGKRAYDVWGGFQIIDMDIKDVDIAVKLKQLIFNKLKKFHWFFGVVLSSSGNGLHIYTKIQVPTETTPEKKKLLYLANYRHKYSFVYLACLDLIDQVGASKDDLMKWLDMAMFKPQQGAFIAYDEHPMINTSFFQDYIYVNIDGVEDLGHPNIDWVAHPDLKQIFKRWEWFEEDNSEDGKLDVEVVKSEVNESSIVNKYHYKHFERWRLANTLVKLYGQEEAYKYLRLISSEDVPSKELKSDCITAARHDKDIDPWAVKRLNTCHGFKIQLNINDKPVDFEELKSKVDIVEDPTEIKPSEIIYNFHITKDQYLTHIKDDILSKIGKINLIEAGAGVGKTEMVKSILNDDKKIILVLPFTSTIKSKIEGNEGWCYAYGNIKPDLNAKCIAMTVDKFSKLNLIEIQTKGFDYIFIDESHLLFQSSYRDVMPKVIEMIRSSELPVIMMSGTPIAETVFFDSLVHLKVKKDDFREKTFSVRVCGNNSDMENHIAMDIATDIKKGVKVLFPTNRGTQWENQLTAKVKFLLKNHYNYNKDLRVEYYKKSNTGEEFMEDVDKNKTMKSLDILFCSNFLSVGVDIEDKDACNVYMNDLWMPQEIEQFANRLRHHDLNIKMYAAKFNADGTPKNIFEVKPLNLQLDDDELRDILSILRICNGMLERNPIEYKYNSLVASIINANKFVQYNSTENRYYLNDIAYKTYYFEEKYRKYAEQLPVIIRGMVSYGYEYDCINKELFKGNGDYTLEDIEDAARAAREDVSMGKKEETEELLGLINEDLMPILRDWKSGRYRLNKNEEYNFDSENFVIDAPNLEVFEAVVPLVLSLNKMFDVDVIKDIFECCRKNNGTFNIAAVKRVRMLTNLVYNNKKNRLDIPIAEYMTDVYDFINKYDGQSINKSMVTEFINSHSLKYAKQESSDTIIIDKSVITMKTITDILQNMFNCMVNVSRPDKNKQVVMTKTEIIWAEKSEVKNLSDEVNGSSFIFDEFLSALSE